MRIDTDVLAKQREELLTQFELAETLFERQERLWNKDIGSEVDFLQAKTSLEALTRSLATLDEQIDKAVIRAPFNGVLDRVFVNVGEMASAPMPVVRVVDLSDLYVRASVSDHYAGVVMAGQPVTVEAQGLEPIESQIRRVGQFIEAANRTIDVTIDLPSGTRACPTWWRRCTSPIWHWTAPWHCRRRWFNKTRTARSTCTSSKATKRRSKRSKPG